MNRTTIQQLIAPAAPDDAPVHWDTPTARHLRLWSSGRYADVLDTSAEYVVRYHDTEPILLREVPTALEEAGRIPKPHYQQPDQRALELAVYCVRGRTGASGTRIVMDETFGQLKLEPDWPRLAAYCYGWLTLTIFVPEKVHLLMDTDLEGPNDLQRRWFVEFLSRQASLSSQIEAELMKSYREICRRVGDEPSIHTREELLDEIEASSLWIRSSVDDPTDAESLVGELHWRTSWDDEHGLLVRLNQHFEIFDVE